MVLYNAFVLSRGLTITQNSICTISDLDRSRLSDTRSAENDRIGADTDPEYWLDTSLIFTTGTACSEQVQRMHNSPECRLYPWSIRIKRRYAVLKGRRERDIVRPPAPVQITPELPTATAFYSGI